MNYHENTCIKTDMKIPVIDIGKCSLCEGCVEVCPLVFRLNETGFIEVAESSDYSASCIEEAIKYCPEDCISWEEVEVK